MVKVTVSGAGPQAMCPDSGLYNARLRRRRPAGSAGSGARNVALPSAASIARNARSARLSRRRGCNAARTWPVRVVTRTAPVEVSVRNRKVIMSTTRTSLGRAGSGLVVMVRDSACVLGANSGRLGWIDVRQAARTSSGVTNNRKGRTPTTPPFRRRLTILLSVAAVSLLSLILTSTLLSGQGLSVEEVPLSKALSLVEDGHVTEAVIDGGADTVTLTLDPDAAVDVDADQVVASFPLGYADDLTTVLLEAKVDVGAETTGSSLGRELTLRVLPIVLILVVLIWAVRSATPSGALRAKTKGPLVPGEVPAVNFDDVAGADEAVAELREMVDFLKNPAKFETVGATRPRGALLVGPPGTGKTLLARAVAGEAGVPFFPLAGSDFVETFVGMGARRVRDLFAQARKAERAIIFIDEIDAVGRARANGPTHGGEGERENTLISLLNEMDGFIGSHVIVLAATNRADTLDPALTRPGRLDRQIQVPNPDRAGRTKILQVHAKSRPIADDVDFVLLARQTPGMSGADLAQIVNEAAMEAARREQQFVDAACFQAAVATVAMGRARESALVTEHDRKVTAWHEAGHTLAAALLPDADDPVSVTIIPRGPAGGVTWMSGSDDLFLTRRKALAKLVVSLAGRAAEEYLLDGEYTQGASGDLEAATRLATAMVTQYAMTDFGYTQVDGETLRIGGQVAAQAHEHIEKLLRDAHAKATDLVRENSDLLDALAHALLAEETLSAERVKQIVAAHP